MVESKENIVDGKLWNNKSKLWGPQNETKFRRKQFKNKGQ